MTPGLLAQAASLALDHQPLPAEQVVAGSPTTGLAVLVSDGPEVGVWEHTPGTSTDVEVDELFVVITGRATLAIAGHDDIELVAGSVVQLTAGMQSTWTVHETLRKVYVA